MITRHAVVLVVLSFAGVVSAADHEIAFERDDILLWKAAVVKKFYHNRAPVAPERWPQHVDLVNRLADSPAGFGRTLFANTVIAKDVVLDRCLAFDDSEG